MIDINWEHQGITNPQLLNLDINNQVVTSSKIKSDPNITLSNDNNSNNNLNQFGGWLGQILSSGIGASSNNIALNIIKGNAIFDGLEKDVGSSVAGTVSGITGNLIGQGINKIGNNSRLSRGIGQGIATGIGTVGGTILSNLIRNGNIAGKATKLFGTAGKGLKAFSTGVESVDKAGNVTKAAGAINPYALGATVLGTGLQAALGPSHEYDGRYGGITKGMDTAYDLVLSAVGFIPGYGQAISGAMALNKGLSNVFGSTDGMTKTDAILGSAFMPAPVKWVNMWGSKKTLNFDNQSILNILSAYDFMQGGYGNLDKRFDLAREEANKRYGTFSQGARRRADRNIEFANNAWNTILDLADLNEIQNIRSQYMSSINNQRYSLMISGGYNPIYVGKQGMKILNNATNHNMGLRLLSAAALIDNKQMILSAQGGTKVRRPVRPLPRKPATREENPELWDEWERRDAERNASKQRVYLLEREAATQRAETNARHALHYSNLATGVAETVLQNALFEPVTQESLQNSNTERLRQELLADKNEYFDKGMDFINAAGMADLGLNVAGPIFQRSFKWALDKAGNLVKVPNKNSLKGFSFNDLPQEKYVYNNKTGEFNVIAPKKEWIQKGENDLVPDYFVSPLEKQRLVATGISPEEALDIMDVRWINSIEAFPGKLRNLGKNTFGDAQNINGRAFVRYNSRKGVKASLNDASTTLNTVFHELGGHGSSLNIGYGTQTIPINMKDILMKIYKHNESLRPQLKPFYQAIKDGNFDLAKSLAKDEGIELSSLKGSSGDVDFKSLKDFIEYMEENLEYSARAIGSNMSNHYGMPNGWNEKQLRDMFTKESVDNLLKNVWNYGVPITVGGSTAATLYNTNK